MANRDRALLGIVVLGAAGFVLAVSGNAQATPKKEPDNKPSPEPKSEPERKQTPLGTDPNSSDDQTALARMLESESSSFRERIVIGWIALMRARRLGITIFQMLTGKQAKYGPRILDGVRRYASTVAQPSRDARATARDLIEGKLQPSEEIRRRPDSPWVELIPPQPSNAEVLEARARELIRVQKPIGDRGDFGGIWARISGSNWYLYNKKSPIIAVNSGDTAVKTLEMVPVIAALDTEKQRVA